MAEKILVGLDDSSRSWDALEYSIDLAKDKGLKSVTAVHSQEVNEGNELEEYRSAEEIMNRAEEIGKNKGVRIETHLLVRGNSPDVDIIKFAENNNYNHIIVGSKGRTGLSRMLLGSVAESIVRKSHCAVTVIRGTCPL